MPTGTPWKKATDPDPVLTESDAAYLAGFFDAEGSVYVRRRQLIVQVANQNKAIVDAFRVFGGSVCVAKPKGTKIPGGYENNADLWQWRGYISAARLLNRAIGPFLRQKDIGSLLVPVIGTRRRA